MSLDPSVLQELVDLGRELDQDVVREVVSAYRKLAPELLAELVAARDAGSLDRVRKAAHTLKGASAQMGAAPLSELARALEVKAKAGRDTDLEALIEGCRSEAVAVDTALTAFLEKQP